ncbi:YdcF family protein [Thermophilibacter immobilis]|jgi:uncharacterized SAM-binding protein YcdF (DUF218 family)|uniref:YdcF family protein n=2 Tax=Thermophilibacter immobilis TaxID=2779519 RepID=A0A7S7MA94_9ACTN|nr:YdcF family protein [Thermophilibacter immobilis]
MVLWSPIIVFGALFLVSYHREPRQFRNAIYLLLFVLVTALILLMRYGQQWMVVPLLLLVLFFPIVAALALIVNGVVVVRRNGLSAASLLPVALALFILSMYAVIPAAGIMSAPAWVVSILELFVWEGMWFSFTLVALLLYSWLYRALPRRRTYDFIVIHGAGLSGTELTPLLAGRVDKALELWERQGRGGLLVVSGGQGSDEEISEAEAMYRYLTLRKGIPAGSIVKEERSTTTMENLRFSKELMDARADGAPYRCAVVTSDYHVFRCAEYAHELGISADGVGSHTRGWYWPAAFIREFAAITRAHFWPYVVILVLWALGLVLSLF